MGSHGDSSFLLQNGQGTGGLLFCSLGKHECFSFDKTHLVQVVLVGSCSADCKWNQKGITVKEGDVVGFRPKTKFTPKKVKICQKSGKLKYKPEKRCGSWV